MTPHDRVITPQPDEPEDNEARELSKPLPDELLDGAEFAEPPEEIYVHLPPSDVEGAIEFLRFLREEDDEEEQRETMEYLVRTLDEDRFSDRKLFPEELKGITW